MARSFFNQLGSVRSLFGAALLAALAVAPQTSRACPRGGHGGGYGGGYSYGYSQPYYTSYAAQPVVYQTQAQVPAASTLQSSVEQARVAFRQRQFDTALGHLQQASAVADASVTSELEQFRSLVLFAKGDVKGASAAAYNGLSTGQIFDWATVAKLYPSADEYTRQYGFLAEAARAKPDDESLQFLLAYHHLVLGHMAEGRAALAAAQLKLPNDKLIQTLLSQIPATASVASSVEAPPAPLAFK